ncbi:MAG: Ig-like domain-containing protein, partial [Deltaproteobacteria bacterium]|nr:Ig-like domain-containing protein [Deltaproteobacteria bacterium]
VVSISPTNGATGADDKGQIVVTFSEPISKGSATDGAITLTNAAGTNITGVLSLAADGLSLSFYASKLLASETVHTVVVAGTIQDMQGLAMGGSYTSTFTVKDTTPPPAPPAGSITSTFPDDEGYIDISATPGTVEAGAAVLIINDDTGMIVGISPLSDGSFMARIQATLGDVIRVVLMDDAGNETLISYITFKTDDGRYLVTSQGGIVEGEGGISLNISPGALAYPTVVNVTLLTEADLLQPYPPGALFGGAVRIEAEGKNFQKEVELSLPLPDGWTEASLPYLLRQRHIILPDGTEEDVYEMIDSMKVIDGRLVTASPPFLGIMEAGIYLVGLFNKPTYDTLTVAGTVFWDKDGISGYQAGGEDIPVRGAIIRLGGTVAISNKDGKYAAVDFMMSETCRYARNMTVYHRFGPPLDFSGIYSCQPPYLVDDFNIRVADVDTKLPDTEAPSITMNLAVATEQDADHQNEAFIAGTIAIGTNLEMPVSIVDENLQSVSLSVGFKSQDTSINPIKQGLIETGTATEKSVSGDPPKSLTKHFYDLFFTAEFAGSSARYFKPQSAGTYTFTVIADDQSGQSTSRQLSLKAVEKGATPERKPGPPQIVNTTPIDKATDFMITMPVTVTFDEGIKEETIDGTNLYLFDKSGNALVPAYVYPMVDGTQMLGVIQPKGNLFYDHEYEIHVTTGIKDLDDMAMAEPWISTFTTKKPRLYDLEGEIFSGGRHIAIHEVGIKTYAYIAAGNEGWHVVDVSNPMKPVIKYSFTPPQFDFRGIAVDPERGILAITDYVRIYGGSNYGYVRFYDITIDPEKPAKIGQERLAEAWSGLPGKVALRNGYAYVSTNGMGLHTVDINSARSYSPDMPGQSITSLLNTQSEGFGQPSDITVYSKTKAFLTTFGGYPVVLDISMPSFPVIAGYVTPEAGVYDAFRGTAVEGFEFTNDEGMNQVIDLAVTSSRTGGIHTVDLSSPTAPVVMAEVRDKNNALLKVIASDIEISREAGLVYIASGGAIYVIDIKNPYHPLMLNVIENALLGDALNKGDVGDIKGIVVKDGWLYMASKDTGLRVLDIDPVFLTHFCNENEFFACNDYYPALGYVSNGVESGRKRILLEGRNSDNQLLNDGQTYARLVSYEPSKGVRLSGRNGERCPASSTKMCALFNDGLAEFHLTTDSLFPWDTEKITMIYEIYDASIDGKYMHNEEKGKKRTTVELKVRTNANVNLQEVLDGTAVYTYEKYGAKDLVADELHKSKTTGGEPNERGFDSVQMMMNHIIPPLEEVVSKENQRSSITPDGLYGNNTVTVLKAIMNGTATGFDRALVNTQVSHQDSRDGYISTFEKINKEYNWYNYVLSANELDEGKVIDKEILIGLDSDDAEIRHPLTDEDIGIYELYMDDDWDDDSINNYIEVENELYPLYPDSGYTNSESSVFSVERGNYGNYNGVEGKQGLLENGLRIANSNKGYYYFRSLDPIDDIDNYGALRALMILENVGKAWIDLYPDIYPMKKSMFVRDGAPNLETYKSNIYTHPDLDHNDDDDDNIFDNNTSFPNEARIGIGDISIQGGGPFPQHVTHQNGLGVDIRFVRNNNTEGSVDISLTSPTRDLFDEELTRELIEILFNEGAFRVYVVAGTGIEQSIDDPNRQIRYANGHHNHLHADFPIVNIPVGDISLSPSPLSMPADGNSTITINVDGKDHFGYNLVAVTASTTSGQIIVGNNVSQSQNVSISDNETMSFQLRASNEPGEAVVTVKSIRRGTEGQIKINFTPVVAE